MAREPQSRSPRSSAQVVRSSLDAEQARHRRRRWLRMLVTLGLIGFLVWGANVSLVGNAVKASLAASDRAAGTALVGHLRWYVDPTTLVLDLQAAGADTEALMAAALGAGNRLMLPGVVQQVLLTRRGQPVYSLSGADFVRIGGQLAERRNPAVVLRALPAALKLPDGTAAAVADAAEAARQWAGGAP